MATVDVEHPWTSITPVVDQITTLAIRELNMEAATIPDVTDNPYEQKDLLRQLARETIDAYGLSVTDATMAWLEEQEEYMGMRPVAWEPKKVDIDRVEARMAHDFGPLFFEEDGYATTVKNLGFLVSDELYGRQRKTTESTAWNGHGSWARVAHPGACAFCMLMASRGFAYKTRETAGGGHAGAHYHDHCRCLVICKKRGKVELPDSTIRAQKIYAEGREQSPTGKPEDILSSMRKVGNLSH